MTHDIRPALTRAQTQSLASVGRVARLAYDLLVESPTPLKAYELLWRLQTKRGRASPPSTIYRSLSTLMAAGLVHRIESLNAFTPCAMTEHPHEPVFFVCERCGSAVETDGRAAFNDVRRRIAPTGFRVKRLNFDVRGVCSSCLRS